MTVTTMKTIAGGVDTPIAIGIVIIIIIIIVVVVVVVVVIIIIIPTAAVVQVGTSLQECFQNTHLSQRGSFSF